MGRSWTQRCLLAIFLLVFCLSLGSCLYFDVPEGEQRCFIQQMPEKNKVIGGFWTQLFDEQKDRYLPPPLNLSVSVVVTDPENQLVLSRQEGSNGTFSFTSSSSGEHRLCLQPSSSQPPPSAGRVLVIHMDVSSASQTDDDAQLQNLNGLMKLQLRVRQLTDQVLQIQKEQDYLRLLEDDFHNINYSTNLWIFLWPNLRALYVVVYVISFTSAW